MSFTPTDPEMDEILEESCSKEPERILPPVHELVPQERVEIEADPAAGELPLLFAIRDDSGDRVGTYRIEQRNGGIIEELNLFETTYGEFANLVGNVNHKLEDTDTLPATSYTENPDDAVDEYGTVIVIV